MLIYILNFVSIPIYNRMIKNKKVFCIIMSLQLFLILALRPNYMGVDMANYEPGFQYISFLSFSNMLSRLHFFRVADLVYPYAYESGWVVLNWVISSMGGNFHTLLVVHALICIYSFGYFIYKNSDCPWLSFAIFVSFSYYIYCFGILRQMMMIAILLFSFEKLKNKKIIKAFIFLIIAFTIHRTAILFLLAFTFIKFPFNKRFYELYIIICVGVIITGSFYLPQIMEIAFRIMHQTGYIARTTVFTYNNMTPLLIFIYVLVFIFSKGKIFERYSRDNWIFSVFSVSVLISLFGAYSSIFVRPNQMFTIMMVPLIPNVISAQKNRQTRIIAKSVVYLLMFGFMVISLHGNDILVPYKFFFMD